MGTQLFLQLLCIGFLSGDLVKVQGNEESYKYNYYYYGNYGGTITKQECYSCTYHMRAGRPSGLKNCGHNFNPEGIPSVPCQGPCAVIYHETSATEYSYTRICLPNCKEDENGYTKCCEGDLCNGGGKESEEAEGPKSCYSCTFQVLSGHEAGSPNCGDPFVAEGIPRVACDGPCAKIYNKDPTNGLEIWVRLCLPYCQSETPVKGLGYTDCCDGHLCNGNM